MNIFKIACLTTLFLCTQIFCYCDIHFISLGRDCQSANQLRNFKLRMAAYPFDWMVSRNFCGIILAIQDDLKHFLDPSLLTYKVSFIENTYYQFEYNHFFPLMGRPITEEVFEAGTIVPNFMDFLPAVQQVQNKRINRLLTLLSSKEDTIVFVRTHASPDEASAFAKMIKKKYPHLNFYLVVVHENENLIGDWNIPNVVNFYACKRSGLADWWNQAEWESIFYKIYQILNPIKI